MLVALHQPRLALASGTHLHRKDLAEEKALLQRSLVARLGRSGETVGVFAGDAEARATLSPVSGMLSLP